jgi:hypothetical protein
VTRREIGHVSSSIFMKLFIFNARIGFLETRRQVCALRLSLMIRDDSFSLMRSIFFGHKKTPQGGVLVIMPMASLLI